MTDLWFDCCVIKIIMRKQLIRKCNLLKGVDVMTSALSCFEIFAGSSYRGSICPTGKKIGSSYREFREIEGSRNRG